MQIEFTVGGKRLSLTQDEVAKKLQGVPPEPTRSLVVEVNGLLYPVKQAFATASGLDRADFISHQARSVLQRLGFKVKRLV